ncbi:MAG: hypothetical protein NC102_04520 [Clostridium sp.]|nr:hypothetical protein [Clostridium sp.]
MYNAIKRLALAALIAASMAACGDEEKEKADAILVEISQSLEAGDYAKALALMDTIDQHYPSQIEARRQVISLRPIGIEKETLAMMAAADSAIAFAQADLQGLEAKMKHVSGDDLEGYYVPADAFNPSFINSTGVEARVNDADFTFYVVAQTMGRSHGIRAVELSSADGGRYESESIPADSERRFTIEGSESAVFIPEEVEGLGQWTLSAGPITAARILTSKGAVDVKIKGPQQRAFATAWQYADARGRLQQASRRRAMLEQRLQIARDQIANTSTSTD